MNPPSERLKNLDDKKLIDIVKNYRQYGYDEDLRNTALSILRERGIDEEQLKLSGQFENYTYTSANLQFKAFRQNSKIAFTLYALTILCLLISIWTNFELLPLLLFLAFFLGFIAFLIQSFSNQNSFFKLINEKHESQGAFLYFILGMPFYVFMFFYFSQRMKERMKRII